MISTIIDAINWGRSLKKFREEKYQDAISVAQLIKNKERIGGRYYSYIGTALVLNRDSQNAEIYFRKGAELSQVVKSPLSDYVNAYCRQYIYIINNGSSDRILQEKMQNSIKMEDIPYYLPIPKFQDS